MKLAPEVLLEIVAIVQNGLVYGKDVSEQLRNLDLEVKSEDECPPECGDAVCKLYLTEQYKATRELFR